MPEQFPIDPARIRTLITPPGGIMTTEVGAITGPVEVWLDEDHVRIRYEGALDTYTVTGSVATRSLDDLVTLLTRDPGPDQYGKPPTYRECKDCVDLGR